MRRILCPVSFSEGSRGAFDRALELCRCSGARLTVLHVASSLDIGVTADPSDRARLEKTAREALLQDLSDLTEPARAAGIPTCQVLLRGGVASHVLAFARATAPDLLVIGKPVRAGLARRILGSVTETVIRKAPCPVLAAPRRDPGSGGPGRDGLRRVLCPVDSSKASLAAAEATFALADRWGGAQVALLHVADRPPGGGNGSRRRTDAGSFFAKQEEALLERLRRVVPGARSLGPGVKRIESAGKADVEILSIAQEEKADLIVLGLSRPSTLRPRIYGSVTCRVVRGANRPVMTVRASDEGGSERRAAQRRAKRP